MSLGPEAFLRQAETLASGSEEADWRSAVSRAYYAAFHAAQRFHASLPMPGVMPPEGERSGMHAVLAHQLKNPSFPKTDPQFTKSRQVGIMLASLHALRVTADYELDAPVTQKDAANAVALGARIIGIC